MLYHFCSLVRRAAGAVWAWSLRPVRASGVLKGLSLFAILFGAMLLLVPKAACAWGLDLWTDEPEPTSRAFTLLSGFCLTWAGIAYALARVTEVEERLRLYEQWFRSHLPPGHPGQAGPPDTG